MTFRIGDQNLEQYVAHITPASARDYAAPPPDELEGIVGDVDLGTFHIAPGQWVRSYGLNPATLEGDSVRVGDSPPFMGVQIYRFMAPPSCQPHFYMAEDGTLTPGAPLHFERENWGGSRWEHWRWLIGLAWWEGVRRAYGFAKRAWYWPNPIPERVFDASDVTFPTVTFDMGRFVYLPANPFDYYASDPNQAGHGVDGGVPMSLAELLGADEEMDRIDRILEGE